MVEDLKPRVPELLLGCELMKIPINVLDRTKMTDILKTAEETLDVIMNLDEEGLSRMTMSTATDKWIEVCSDKEWNSMLKEFIFVLGAKKGKISGPCLSSSKKLITQFSLGDLSDDTPILLDSIWFEMYEEHNNKKRIKFDKRSRADLSWGEESEPKKHELEVPLSADRLALEEERVMHLEQLEELRIEKENELQQQREAYEQRLNKVQEQEQYIANEIDNREHENQQIRINLENDIKIEKAEKVKLREDLSNLNGKMETMDNERTDLRNDMSEMRNLVQSLREKLSEGERIKKEAFTSRADDWPMQSDSDDDDNMILHHSSPIKNSKRIANISNVPQTLTKLGMPIFNPAKCSKIEYLSKFTLMTEDYTEEKDLKYKKTLLFQALADDKNFRIHDLSSDDKTSMEKLIKAIIAQEYGDSVDLMKNFEAAQLKHGESHLNYYHRILCLYQIAANLTGEWQKDHSHALKIYFKIEDSLPSSAKSKFRELMMTARKASTMTVKGVRDQLDIILTIYKDELKIAMGSQLHSVPMVDAIQAKPSQYETTNKKEMVCWKCNKSGHMKRDCRLKGNTREPKTQSGSSFQRKCYKCGGVGHFAAQCATKSQEHSKWSGEKTK